MEYEKESEDADGRIGRGEDDSKRRCKQKKVGKGQKQEEISVVERSSSRRRDGMYNGQGHERG